MGNVVVQSVSCVQLFVTLWTAACQASLSFTISWSLLKFMSIEWVMLLTISSSATPKVQESKQNSNKIPKPLLCPVWQGKSHEEASDWGVTGLRVCVWVCVCVCVCVRVRARALSPSPFMSLYWEQPNKLLGLWDFPGKNTEVGCLFLLQGIFLTLERKMHLLCLLHLAGGYFTLCLESPGLGFDGGNVFCLQEILRKGSEFFFRMI